MQNISAQLVVLGTGGTIAGTAASAADHTGYTAAQLGIAQLLGRLPGLDAASIDSEQAAQLDSKDMDHTTWRQLAARVNHHLARDEVQAVVVTHGTDTLEETAYFLHRTVRATKPVVLTAAMRPATAASPDGPQNLLDALAVAREPGARGVVTVMAGRIVAAVDLRKLHGYRVDAFAAGDAGALGVVEDGAVRRFRDWPAASLHPAAAQLGDAQDWPVVDIVTSHAGARGATLDALVAAGAHGIVIAGTGNGTVHQALLEAARRAELQGVRVWRSSRCLLGGVVGGGVGQAAEDLPARVALTPVQARIELMLDLIADPTRCRT